MRITVVMNRLGHKTNDCLWSEAKLPFVWRLDTKCSFLRVFVEEIQVNYFLNTYLND